MHKTSSSRVLFLTFNYIFLAFLALICLFPIIHILAVSFSNSSAATAGLVKLWPVDFTTKSYEFVLKKHEFIDSLAVTIKRVVLGVSLNMLLTILVAYPLSKSSKAFRLRQVYIWFFVITILFSGGLIPLYMTVRKTGLIDSILALILPVAVPVFNVILLMNFFRELPKEIEEAAFIDGAGYWLSLCKIYVPLSIPALATLVLFSAVNHWNSWFDGLIFMNSPKNYPLQSYLQTIIVSPNLATLSPSERLKLAEISDKTTKSAQIFLGALPILMIYPFLQKYFMKGIVMGSVKG